MADTLTTLAAHSPTAERALFAPLDWVVIGSGTGGQTATVTAVAQKQHLLCKAVVSFNAAPAGVLLFTVKDGASGTTLFQMNLPANAMAPIVLTFERPISGSINTALVGAVDTPGGSTIATIWMGGITIRQP